MEESLGKGGKGIVVFDDQTLNASAPGYQPEGMLRVHVVTEADTGPGDDEPLSSCPALPCEHRSAEPPGSPGRQFSWLAVEHGALWLSAAHSRSRVSPPSRTTRHGRALTDAARSVEVASHWQPALHDGILTLLAPTGTSQLAGTAAATAFAEALHCGCLRRRRFPGLSRRDRQRGGAGEPARHA